MDLGQRGLPRAERRDTLEIRGASGGKLREERVGAASSVNTGHSHPFFSQ
jgi:hypothetical protein